jgi:hypothetical protein
VADVFARINEGEAFRESPLDYRADHGVLEVADREFFDRRERTLATYDLSGLVGGRTGEDREKVIQDLTSTITEFASPPDWRHNGGELGVLTTVDSRLFVEAPPRMHRQVKWILDQLMTEADRGPRAAGGDPTGVRLFTLMHVPAEEALQTLRRLDGIREIDFSKFTVDARNNAIIGTGDAATQDRVKGALAVLDRALPEPERSAPANP